MTVCGSGQLGCSGKIGGIAKLSKIYYGLKVVELEEKRGFDQRICLCLSSSRYKPVDGKVLAVRDIGKSDTV